jgi:hypothetical protein
MQYFNSLPLTTLTFRIVAEFPTAAIAHAQMMDIALEFGVNT